MELANHNKTQLVWVPGHEGTAGNETADQLAKSGSEHSFIGPEPACGISMGVAKKAIRDWMTMNRKKHWKSLTGKGTHTGTLYQKSKETTEVR
jgi:ribonuclease HI